MNEEQRTGPEAETIEGDAARMSAAQRTAATDGEPGAEVASDAPWCRSITPGQSSHVGEERTAVGAEDSSG